LVEERHTYAILGRKIVEALKSPLRPLLSLSKGKDWKGKID
jgi:hypothetical protein